MKLTHLNEKKEYIANPLKFEVSDLSPILSKKNVDYHFNTHTKGYAEKANENHDDFNVAGLELHNIWWSILSAPSEDPDPSTKIVGWVEKHFKSFKQFQEKWKEAALSIQGNGWVCINKKGKINIIKNHEMVKDIVMILDVWEHSYYPTYGPDKEKYIDEMWKIYNWDEIYNRL